MQGARVTNTVKAQRNSQRRGKKNTRELFCRALKQQNQVERSTVLKITSYYIFGFESQ